MRQLLAEFGTRRDRWEGEPPRCPPNLATLLTRIGWCWGLCQLLAAGCNGRLCKQLQGVQLFSCCFVTHPYAAVPTIPMVRLPTSLQMSRGCPAAASWSSLCSMRWVVDSMRGAHARTLSA